MSLIQAIILTIRTHVGSILCAGGITYLSLIREPHFRLPSFSFADKWGHMLMYFVWAAVLISEIIAKRTKNADSIGLKHYLYACLIPILYGGLMEILQENFFPPRTGDWWDWLADAIGAAMGVISIFVWKKVQPSKSDPND